MKLRRLQATAISLLFSLGAFATDGSDGNAELKASATKATVGENVNLTVTVSGITNGEGIGAKDGKCVYSVTIPSGLTNVSGSNNDQNLSGKGKNATYDHGTYTTSAVGKYTFGINVTTGTTSSNTLDVYFCPVAPVVSAATNITSKGFTANWNEVSGATYKVSLYKGEQLIDTYNSNETSYDFSELEANTTYEYCVNSIVDEIESVNPSQKMSVTTLKPIITMTSVSDLETYGDQLTGTFIVDLLNATESKVVLALGGDGASAYTISPTVVKAFPSEVTYTFAPSSVGTFNATVTATSANADNQVLTIKGVSKEVVAPVLQEATEIESSGFTANWNAVEGATGYILNIYDANGNAVDGYENLEVGNVTTFVVDNIAPEQTYTCDVYAVSGNNKSEKSNKIQITTPKGAVVTYVAIGEFETPAGATAEKTIYVDGVNLTGDVTVSLDGDAAFSTNVSSITATEGAANGAVAITFAPTVVGAYSATVSLATAGAKTKTINISGKALPSTVTALAATAVSENGFTANWEGEKGATYVVTLVDMDGVENKIETTGTSYVFTGLESGETYTYTVQIKENGLLSYRSAEITATTLSAPSVSVNAGKTGVALTWNKIENASNYKAILYKDGESINTSTTTNCSVSFDGLTENTEYSYEVKAEYGNGSEVSSGVKNFTTKSYNVYGQQIENSDFEAWENEGKDEVEPVEWNSFMNLKSECTLCGMAKAKQLDYSTSVRPGSTGKRSAKIWSRDVSIAVANGNLTTGRIVAGSTTAKDQANHNFTDTGNSLYNQVLTSRPDSITVWVKYKPNNTSSTASVSAIIHDNTAFEDPWESGSEAHIVANANKVYSSEGGKWQRLAVPFDYDSYKSNGLDPSFILVTFNSNSTPGGGAANDSVNIDDILLIYNPTLTIGSLSKTQYEPGDVISLPYTIEGTMSPYNLDKAANVVSLEISDATGNFDNATVLTSVTTDESGTLTAQLPSTLADGNLYKLRVVTTNYPMTSDASNAFVVRNVPADVVATEATDVTAVSFKANWEAAANAQSYVLTVKKANGDVLKTVETAETTATITGLSSETSYSYTVKAVNDYLTSQNNSNVVTVKTAGGGSISYDGKTSFTGVAGQAQNATITVTGAGLIDVIHVLKSGSADFSIDDVTELNAEGGVLNVTYNPSTVGVQTASIKLSSKLVNPAVTITLTGTVLPQTVSTAEATDVTMSSFTANWNASAIEGAKYVFTLYSADGMKISSEEVDGTSKIVTGLSAATAYSYTVAVKVSGLTSEESAAQNVTTVSIPVINSLDVTSLSFTSAYTVASDAQKITVSGSNLQGNITAAISGDNADMFSLSATELSNGDELSITYTPSSFDSHSAILTLSSVNAESVTLDLKGTPTLAKVEALPATNVTENGWGYTANWNATPGATKYQATFLYDVNGEPTQYILQDLDASVTSYDVYARALRDKVNYYVIKAFAGLNNEYESKSDTIVISLIKPAAVAASEATDVTETGFTANWEASEDESVKYILTVTSNGVEVSKDTLIGTSKAITGLTAGTEYSYTVYTLNVVGLKSASASNVVTVTTTANEGGNTNPSDDPETPEDPTTAVSENSAAKLTIYPNPAVSVINISGVDAKSVSIYSSTGALVEATAETVINVSDLAAGLYHAVVVDNNGKKFAKSFIKE